MLLTPGSVPAKSSKTQSCTVLASSSALQAPCNTDGEYASLSTLTTVARFASCRCLFMCVLWKSVPFSSSLKPHVIDNFSTIEIFTQISTYLPLSACLERLLRNHISVSGFRIRQRRLPRLRIHLGVSLSGERKPVMSIAGEQQGASPQAQTQIRGD